MSMRLLPILLLLGASSATAQSTEEEVDDTAPAFRETAAEEPLKKETDSEPVPIEERVGLGEESDLSTKSQTELQEAGFVFGADANLTTSSTASLVALVAGIPIHGIGHFWIDDKRTATALLIAEGASVVAMLASGTYILLDGHASTMSGVAASVFELGLSTFVMGYLLDVIGTVQGSDREFTLNTRNSPGLHAEVSYGFLSTTQLPTRHLLKADLGLDTHSFFVGAEAASDIDTASFDGRVRTGARLFRQRPQTFLLLEALGDVHTFRETGAFWRTGIEGRIGGSLDLGTFFTQLSQVGLGFWVGLGRHFFLFDEQFSLEVDGATNYLGHQVYLHFNATDNLNIMVSHGRHPAWYIAPINSFIGATDLEVLYRTNFGRLRIGTTLGDGVGLWLGGQLHY